jgi:hypothetical protein
MQSRRLSPWVNWITISIADNVVLFAGEPLERFRGWSGSGFGLRDQPRLSGSVGDGEGNPAVDLAMVKK